MTKHDVIKIIATRRKYINLCNKVGLLEKCFDETIHLSEHKIEEISVLFERKVVVTDSGIKLWPVKKSVPLYGCTFFCICMRE